MLDPTKFFEAAREYDKSSQEKGFTRCGTIDSNYVGSGPAKVMFDGEDALSGKSYQYLNTAPRAGSRVVLLPIGPTYVILGMINGGA